MCLEVVTNKVVPCYIKNCKARVCQQCFVGWIRTSNASSTFQSGPRCQCGCYGFNLRETKMKKLYLKGILQLSSETLKMAAVELFDWSEAFVDRVLTEYEKYLWLRILLKDSTFLLGSPVITQLMLLHSSLEVCKIYSETFNIAPQLYSVTSGDISMAYRHTLSLLDNKSYNDEEIWPRRKGGEDVVHYRPNAQLFCKLGDATETIEANLDEPAYLLKVRVFVNTKEHPYDCYLNGGNRGLLEGNTTLKKVGLGKESTFYCVRRMRHTPHFINLYE
jgi:hypothetical protein